MPKKVKKKQHISVSSKKQGYWIKKENLHKGERTIKAKGDKVLVKRNRSGYDYSRTITGYEWSKAELKKKLAERAEKGLIQAKAVARDISQTHRITKTAPIITAEKFFKNKTWNEMDIFGVDTPPAMTLKEIREFYAKHKQQETKTPKKKISRPPLDTLIEYYTLKVAEADKKIDHYEKKLSLEKNKLSKEEIAHIKTEIVSLYRSQKNDFEKLWEKQDEWFKTNKREMQKEIVDTVRAKISRNIAEKIRKLELELPQKERKTTTEESLRAKKILEKSVTTSPYEAKSLDDLSPAELKEGLDLEHKRLKKYVSLQSRAKSSLLKNKLQTHINSTIRLIDRLEKALYPETKKYSKEFKTLANKYNDLIVEAKLQMDQEAVSRLYDEWEKEKEELYRKIAKEKIKTEQQKSEKKQKKTVLPSQIASESDINIQTATRAYSNVSWSPERRGESIRKYYAEHVNSFYEELKDKVPPEKHAELLEELENYREKYKERLEGQLHRLSRIASSAVVGRSNFPVSSMKKRNAIYDRKENEFREWDAKVQRAIRKKFGLIKGGGISSDDPKAIDKLSHRIAELKKEQEHMKKANKIVRSKKLTKEEKIKELKKLGYDQFDAEKLFKEDFLGRNAYPSYLLSNNSANIRRLEQRKAMLEEQRSKKTETKTIATGVRIEDNVEDNRLRIYFDSIPDEKIRTELKSRGFRWSPKNKAWQRYRSNSANYWAEQIAKQYAETKK